MNPPSLAPAPLNLIIPQDVRYDGVQQTPRGALLQFTNLAPGVAHGATFYLLEREASSVVLARLTAQIRRTFAQASREGEGNRRGAGAQRKAVGTNQRQPRRVTAPEINHY